MKPKGKDLSKLKEDFWEYIKKKAKNRE